MKTKKRYFGTWTADPGFIALLLCALVACQSAVNKGSSLAGDMSSPNAVELRRLPAFSIESQIDFSASGCKGMLDNYCARLNSPEASGNLLIDRQRPIQILRGETSNQLSQVFVKYAHAKLRNRGRLPQDFIERLNAYGYFEKLENLINRSPIQRMSLPERLNSERLEAEIAFIWETAIDQTIVVRMTRKYSGYHQIPDRAMPIEYGIEEKRARRILISEISRTLWREDSNWKKVEEEFRNLKLSFFALIEHLDTSAEVRESWRKKIESVELVLPGSSPEISDEECSTTTANAYFYKNLNLITVCAGDFNSEDIVLTLAHEMSHALGIDRDLLQFLTRSKLQSEMVRLRSNVCESRERLSCDQWNDFKAAFSRHLSEIGDFSPELPEFNRCLKKGLHSKSLSPKEADRIADSIVINRISSLASANVFLRIVEKKVPMRSGQLQNNPNYMNPCGYYLWSTGKENIDDELYTLVFFTAEYQCGTGDKSSRMKKAIETAQTFGARLSKAVLTREGEFSARPELVAEGLSSPPFERFADVVGAYAVSHYLQRYPEISERRSKYLASTSWLCGEPSLETHFPELSKIEQLFSLQPHSTRDSRKLDILAAPVRETLQCRQDFSFDECQLPLLPQKNDSDDGDANGDG